MIPNLIVQKYGGASLATPGQLSRIADHISQLSRTGHRLIVVVSAMGQSTDQLIELAYQVSPRPNRRELDMLISTGERVSMALMSMALNDRGCRAISFTGSQAGVLTDDSHSNARIIDLKPSRVEAELERGSVVVLAGFQGVSPTTKEIMTLGRGGSDTTAVAMAAHFAAESCEIRKEVDGVYSADPKIVANAVHLPHLHYQHLLDMTYWGAKVLHYRSVELASTTGARLIVTRAEADSKSTIIDGSGPMFESDRILSVNSHENIVLAVVKSSGIADGLHHLEAELSTHGLPWPQILASESNTDGCELLLAANAENLKALKAVCAGGRVLWLKEQWSSVTVTCQGGYTSGLAARLSQHLAMQKITAHRTLSSAMSLTFIVDRTDREAAIRSLHNASL